MKAAVAMASVASFGAIVLAFGPFQPTPTPAASGPLAFTDTTLAPGPDPTLAVAGAPPPDPGAP
ncbi:MAG: serine/threonine protein kinase, partial [Acidimicrobiales bacterium]|nr:serine/threonine protein kinase [Acidimicrobiales bacterium]